MIVKLSSFIGFALAAGGSGWDYKFNGADWVKKDSCGGKRQSPIDLKTYWPKKVEEQPWSRVYANYINRKEFKWDGHTSKMDFDGNEKPNYFTAWQAKNERKTSDTWEAVQFHWHSESEHTINGQRYDLEIHFVHKPTYKVANENNGFPYAVVGLLFDVNNHYGDPEGGDFIFRQKYIDPLFDSLKLDKESPKDCCGVPAGKLLNALENYERFQYRGSLTTPPCSETLYWNVINYVFPIKKEHLDQFKAQLKWNKDYDLSIVGNYRVINEINEHDPVIVAPPYNIDANYNAAVWAVIFFIISISLCISTGFWYSEASKAEAGDQKSQGQGEGGSMESAPSLMDMSANFESTRSNKKAEISPKKVVVEDEVVCIIHNSEEGNSFTTFDQNLNKEMTQVEFKTQNASYFIKAPNTHKMAFCCTTKDNLRRLQQLQGGMSIKHGSFINCTRVCLSIDKNALSDDLVQLVFKYAMENGLNIVLTHDEDGFQAFQNAYEQNYFNMMSERRLSLVVQKPDETMYEGRQGLFIWVRTPETEEISNQVAQADSTFVVETLVGSSGSTIVCSITDKPTPAALNKAWKALLKHQNLLATEQINVDDVKLLFNKKDQMEPETLRKLLNEN